MRGESPNDSRTLLSYSYYRRMTHAACMLACSLTLFDVRNELAGLTGVGFGNYGDGKKHGYNETHS